MSRATRLGRHWLATLRGRAGPGRLKSYPRVLSEWETLECAHNGVSLGRYGDGEFNHCFGRRNVTQPADPRLTRELRELLLSDDPRVLPCIPNVYSDTPKNWLPYAGRDVRGLLRDRAYGSAFISRADSAPWIDTPEYWERVVDLWRGKDVALAIGTKRSLLPDLLKEASSVRVIHCPPGWNGDGAYAKIDEIEEEIGRPSGPALLCIGPTGTVLAARLACKGVHGLDLGHIGMFMRAAGAYRISGKSLASKRYRRRLAQLHCTSEDWGGGGHTHGGVVAAFAAERHAETILDYGCGRGTLRSALAGAVPPGRVAGYDPGVPGKEGPPEPAALVVCTDVLQHVEPGSLDAVMAHIHALCLDAAYFVIALRSPNASRPDHRYTPLILEDPDWWLKKIADHGWKNARAPQVSAGDCLRVWVRR